MTVTETGRTSLADGEWHRLHPATPLLKGGIALVVVFGFVVNNLRERVVEFFTGQSDYGGKDALTEIYENGLIGWALLAVAVFIIIAVVAFYFSWRMHTFRVGEESVEMRSGILFRTHRQARLDRIQGINIIRPMIARIFGAAKLEVSVAGQGANVQLSYLSSALADELRRDILRLASGVQRRAATAHTSPAAVPEVLEGAEVLEESETHARASARAGDFLSARAGDFLSARANEFLSPELDPDAAPPESIVKIPPGRLIGSLVLSGFSIFLFLLLVGVIVGVSFGKLWVLLAVVPGLIASISFYTRRFTKSLRYTIAGTRDGVRVGFGLLSTSNDTIPPGRIHAIEVRQPLLWRPFGWWEIRINRAGTSAQGAAGQANTTTLPVGDFTDVQRVLGLLIPGFIGESAWALIASGMLSKGGDGLFIDAPKSAAWLRPFSWRRTGYRIFGPVVLLRHGVLWRQLVVVPLARVQSITIQQGPIRRVLGLTEAGLHTVSGPVRAAIDVIDREAALTLFSDVAREAVLQAASDTSEHWGRLPDNDSLASAGFPVPRSPTLRTDVGPEKAEVGEAGTVNEAHAGETHDSEAHESDSGGRV